MTFSLSSCHFPETSQANPEKSGVSKPPTSKDQNTISSMTTAKNAGHHEYLHLAGSFEPNAERQMVFPVIVY